MHRYVIEECGEELGRIKRGERHRGQYLRRGGGLRQKIQKGKSSCADKEERPRQGGKRGGREHLTPAGNQLVRGSVSLR